MDLYGILLFKLGRALARAAVKCWVGDSELIADVTGDVTDLLLTAGCDAREAHRAKRELSEIAEQVADRLEPFFTAEYGGSVASHEAAAAAAAVAKTIEIGFTDPKIALEQDLDVERLNEHLRLADPDRTSRECLNPAATRLYEVALFESCSYLIQMVADLPSFATDSARQLLSNDRAIVRLLEDALRRLPAADLGLQALEFRTRYLRAVTNALDQVRLFGLQEVNRAVRRYALSVAYISLSVNLLDPLTAEDDDRDEDEDDVPLNQKIAIEQLLSTRDRVLLRGQAGSGKTTLLQWLAVQIALGELPSDLRRLNRHIPFFIRLRHYVDRPLPLVSEFIDDVARHISGLMPDGWVESMLDDGTAVVLIDGIDELPRARRRDAEDWLGKLVEAYPEATYVVTSRPASLESGFDISDTFDNAELAPMGPSETRLFIDHWHRAVARALPEPEQAEFLRLGIAMVRVISREHSLARLASNPLMAAVLCALHADRKARLPRDRIDLYRLALNTLLFRRDADRGVQLEIAMSETQLLLALKDMAWWMVTQGYTEASKTIAQRRMQLTLDRMSDVPPADQVMLYLVERSGLINEPIHGRIEFLHKTFLEFFAAEHAVEMFEIGALVQRATDDAWGEIVLLAAGLASPTSRYDLINGLLTASVRGAARKKQIKILAAACVDRSPEVDPALRKNVNAELATLVPPKTVVDGLALARAGEAAVKFLPWSPGLSADAARASVRALAEIGGPLALEQLVDYANDGRKVVIRQLVDARSAFDGVEYATRVLAESSLGNGKLELEAAEDLSYLGVLRHLSGLTINAKGRAIDFQGLTAARSLESLDIAYCPDVYRMGDLGYHPQLKNLRLAHVPRFSSLEGVEGWPLRRVELVEAPELEDLRPLADTPELCDLRLEATAVTDLVCLSYLTRLRKVFIAAQSAVELSILGELSALRQLRLERIGADLDLSWLAWAPALRSVDICECWGGITFAPFEHEAALDWLMLDRSEADLSDVRGIAQLIIARTRSPLVSLASTGCQKLTVVESDVEVIDLPSEAETVEFVSCARLAKIRNLADCRVTRMTIADCTNLDDLSFLAELPSLRSVWLRGQSADGAGWRIAGLADVEIRVCDDMSELQLNNRVARVMGSSDGRSA